MTHQQAEAKPERHGALASPVPPPGAAADWTVPQHWGELTAEDHWVWDTLFARQQTLLHDRAVTAFQEGLDILHLSRPGVPNFDELSEKLQARTGWTVVAVPGLVPDDVFFDHLSKRRFPAGNFIRQAKQLDYLEEPDVFHDVFGHVPLLVHPVFGDYMQAYGAGGLKALNLGALENLARLYWYTVEFGLIRTPEGLRIYGSGIVSSKGESIYALEDLQPKRIAFDLLRIMRTLYRIDDFQENYFVIDSFDQLFDATRPDFTPYYRELAGLPTIAPGEVVEGDRLL